MQQLLMLAAGQIVLENKEPKYTRREGLAHALAPLILQKDGV
jgi:hypothetical protein